jgi:hypothetical protein
MLNLLISFGARLNITVRGTNILHYIFKKAPFNNILRQNDLLPLVQRIVDLYPGILTLGRYSVLLEAHSACVLTHNAELEDEIKSVIRFLLEKGIDTRIEFEKFLT